MYSPLVGGGKGKRNMFRRQSADKPVISAEKRPFERKIARSRILMLLEQAWPLLWLPVGVAILFALAAIYGLWPLLPGFLHIILLALFAVAFIISLAPLARLAPPERQSAIRWLEKRSGLPHRPASALDDSLPSGSDAASKSLWRAHRRRIKKHVDAMRTGLPRPNTTRIDPYALRIPLVLALAVSIGLYGERLRPGLGEAFSFGGGAGADGSELRIDAWITPPAYTGAPPILLADGGDPTRNAANDVIRAPEGSELVVRIWGANSTRGRLMLTPFASKGDKDKKADAQKPLPREAKARQDNKVRDMRVKLTGSTRAQLSLDGDAIANWRLFVIPNHAPAIALLKKPSATPRASLKLSYRMTDDYGVVEARAHFKKVQISRSGARRVLDSSPVSLAPDDLLTPLGKAPNVLLTLPKGNAKLGNARSYADLTAHPWAGLMVQLTLTARDAGGKSGASEPVIFRLPARRFSKPLAREVVKLRRILVERPLDRVLVASDIDKLTFKPEKNIKSLSVYLGLRTAYWRLIEARTRKSVSTVVDLLWDIALSIEDGNLSQAERDLRAAQDRLMDALANKAPPQEVEKLMKELRQALAKFLQAMAQKQRQQQGEPQQGGNQRVISPRQLDEILKNIENMAKTGARDAARQMLGQLRDMLENLNQNASGQGRGNQKMRQSLDDLGRMIMQQRRLMDETHRQQQQQLDQRRRQNGQRPGQRNPQQGRQSQKQRQGQDQGLGQGRQSGRKSGGGGGGELQGRQGKLLDDLNGLIDKMSGMGLKIPEDLMRAGSNMGRAEQQLGRGRMGAAKSRQGRALENLRRGARNIAEQMMKNRPGRNGQTGRNNRDPLGRNRRNGGPEFGEDVQVPDEIDTQRARDILEELRRRLGQSRRPAKELDYLERLIEQF